MENFNVEAHEVDDQYQITIPKELAEHHYYDEGVWIRAEGKATSALSEPLQEGMEANIVRHWEI